MQDPQKRELLARFEACGPAAVQAALNSPGLNQMFGVPEIPGARDLAREWVAGELRARNLRDWWKPATTILNIVGSILGAVAALWGLMG